MVVWFGFYRSWPWFLFTLVFSREPTRGTPPFFLNFFLLFLGFDSAFVGVRWWGCRGKWHVSVVFVVGLRKFSWEPNRKWRCVLLWFECKCFLPFRSPSHLLAAVKWSKKLIWVLWVLSGIVYVSFPGNQTKDGVFIYDSNAHALMFLPFGVINSCAPVCVPRRTEENNGSVLGLWILTFEWVHLRTFSREPNKADITQHVLFWCFLYPT